MAIKYLSGIKSLPLLFQGYNIHVKNDKLELLKTAFTKMGREIKTCVDCGGVWRVNCGYSRYAARELKVDKVVLIDRGINNRVIKKMSRISNVYLVKDDFGSDDVIKKIGKVDAVIFYDVLIHQVAPNWDKVLKKYSAITDCFVIYNQQYIGQESISRLTDLSLEKYKALVPVRQCFPFYDYVWEHPEEIVATLDKPLKDVHCIWQWAITDKILREKCEEIGFEEVFYKNYGQFPDFRYFENHGFVFFKMD